MSKQSPFNNEIILSDFCIYKNEVDFVDKLLSIYSAMNSSKPTKKDKDKTSQLRQFEKDVLIYYIRFGYSTETKKRISKELGKTLDSVTQANFHLTNKGYLVSSKTNHSNKKLNKEMQRIRDGFILGNKKILAIGFKRK
tara:strand:- start:758 stop:1174 length:417 start_codon:yes stop_codon:yes gene_type:complete